MSGYSRCLGLEGYLGEISPLREWKAQFNCSSLSRLIFLGESKNAKKQNPWTVVPHLVTFRAVILLCFLHKTCYYLKLFTLFLYLIPLSHTHKIGICRKCGLQWLFTIVPPAPSTVPRPYDLFSTCAVGQVDRSVRGWIVAL